jgi:hypothetical protein
VHMMPEGNVSVDVSITHPFDNPAYTGFDVRGIIMFPSSQIIPDDDVRALAGLDPYTGNTLSVSSSTKGDAELVNGEGWTRVWNPDPHKNFGFWTEWEEDGFPIFDYYQGKLASGDHIGCLNPFIRFHSTETRHMFEVGKTVMRTYIIKPPAQGPIQACYGVYAHWSEPDVTPVTNPATDFPLDANSCMPYELQFSQVTVIDPDAPPEVQAEAIRIHMKDWGVIPIQSDEGSYFWRIMHGDYVVGMGCSDGGLYAFSELNEYRPEKFKAVGLYKIPGAFPGTWPIAFALTIDDPYFPGGIGVVGKEYWIMNVEFGALDGEW